MLNTRAKQHDLVSKMSFNWGKTVKILSLDHKEGQGKIV